MLPPTHDYRIAFDPTSWKWAVTCKVADPIDWDTVVLTDRYDTRAEALEAKKKLETADLAPPTEALTGRVRAEQVQESQGRNSN
jgi:hypothetical protein